MTGGLRSARRPDAGSGRERVMRRPALVLSALVLAVPVIATVGWMLPDTSVAQSLVWLYPVVALGIGWAMNRVNRRFMLAQESAIEVTFLVSPEGVVQYASPSVRRVLGYEPAELNRRPLEGILDPRSPRDWLPGPARVDDFATELGVRDAHGAWRVLDTVVMDRRTDRNLAGVVLRARDVTARKTAEEQNRRQYSMQVIGGLAGALAHDFNNVLTTIQGNADLLREDLTGNDAAEVGLGEIQQAAARASRFVQLLLAFTRQQTLRPKPIDLGLHLRDRKRCFDELLGPTIELELHLEDGLPGIFFDPARLQRILFVLVARARDQMPDGGRLTITAARGAVTADDARRFPYTVNPGDYVVMTISDSGRQLSDAEKAAAFEPFAVAVGADATGLELSSVYGTIKQSGGYVWIEDATDSGTTFRICLRPVDATCAVLNSQVEVACG